MDQLSIQCFHHPGPAQSRWHRCRQDCDERRLFYLADKVYQHDKKLGRAVIWIFVGLHAYGLAHNLRQDVGR